MRIGWIFFVQVGMNNGCPIICHILDSNLGCNRSRNILSEESQTSGKKVNMVFKLQEK